MAPDPPPTASHTSVPETVPPSCISRVFDFQGKIFSGTEGNCSVCSAFLCLHLSPLPLRCLPVRSSASSTIPALGRAFVVHLWATKCKNLIICWRRKRLCFSHQNFVCDSVHFLEEGTFPSTTQIYCCAQFSNCAK